MEETIMAKEIGYRTEAFFEEGYRNAASVMAHETFPHFRVFLIVLYQLQEYFRGTVQYPDIPAYQVCKGNFHLPEPGKFFLVRVPVEEHASGNVILEGCILPGPCLWHKTVSFPERFIYLICHFYKKMADFYKKDFPQTLSSRLLNSRGFPQSILKTMN